MNHPLNLEQKFRDIGADENCICERLIFENGAVALSSDRNCPTHPPSDFPYPDTLFYVPRPIEIAYVAAFTRHDHAQKLIGGLRPAILPANPGKVHAVVDVTRTVYPKHNRMRDEYDHSRNDFEELWRTRQPLFRPDFAIDYHFTECSIYAKVLLPRDFPENDPDACQECVTRVYEAQQSAAYERERWAK